MTGAHDGVIGMDRSSILARFLSALPQRFETAIENPRLNGVIVDAEESTGRARSISRISLSSQEIEALTALPVPAR